MTHTYKNKIYQNRTGKIIKGVLRLAPYTVKNERPEERIIKPARTKRLASRYEEVRIYLICKAGIATTREIKEDLKFPYYQSSNFSMFMRGFLYSPFGQDVEIYHLYTLGQKGRSENFYVLPEVAFE